jgi:cytochrome c-type biogenesis protein CcmH/NrfG
VPLFRESLRADAGAATPHYHLGFALLALNRTAEGIKELKAALKLSPNAKEAGEARAALARTAKSENHPLPH